MELTEWSLGVLLKFDISRLLLALISIFVLSACTAHTDPKLFPVKQKKLYTMLVHTVSGISAKDANTIARESVSYSSSLALEYNVTTPPLIHNFLVNINAKDRGLCYQWSDDLYAHLSKYNLKTVQIRPVGANIQKYWSEHNALVVLPAKDINLEHGVILDPWRKSGDLYFAIASKDPEYKWELRMDRGY